MISSKGQAKASFQECQNLFPISYFLFYCFVFLIESGLLCYFLKVNSQSHGFFQIKKIAHLLKRNY